MPLEICHPNLNWKALYRENGICGPAQLWIGDRQILSFVHCQYDGLEDRDMTLDKKRFFRKGGARVHFASGHFPNGNAITQTAKFFGNTCHITTDVKWCAGNVLKDAFEICSFVLPGTWKRLFNVAELKWQDLPKSGTLELPDNTPAVVFEDENSNQIEAGLGDDLWRWDNGLFSGGENRGKFTIEIQAGKILVTRAVSINTSKEPATPAPRFYRFESYFAWYAPSFDKVGSTCNDPVRIDTPPACWEGRTIQHEFRTAIRKAAECKDNKCIAVTSAMASPTFCDDGKHFNRKNAARHWDICSIMDAASWARQTLGIGRNFCADANAPWNEFPSFKGLKLPNGFSNDDVIGTSE